MIYGAIIGAIAGGVGAGVSSLYNNKKLANKYKQYAQSVRDAANRYSGHAADTALREAGDREARRLNNLNMGIAANQPQTSNLSTQNAIRGIGNTVAADSTVQGQNVGRTNKAIDLNSKYNKATADAQLALNQGKVDYNAGMAAATGAMQGAETLAKTYNTIVSDERVKEYNNHSGLPKADAADALRQIESVEYKYKPETGLDQDKHVGVTAQSLEGTAFDDAVVDNGGVKELDKQKLLESVMSGIAALQKELDEKEKKWRDKRVSDFLKYNNIKKENK